MKCQGRANFYPPICDREATVERNGKVYCWQHDPERLRAVAKKKANELRDYEAQLESKWAREDLERFAGLRPEQIAKLTDEQLRMIADAGGITAFIF